MLIAALVIGVIALVAAAVAATWMVLGKLYVGQVDAQPVPLLISRRVVVNLKSGTAVAGVITARDTETLTVKGAEVIEPGATAPTPADGEILIDRAHVDYIQAL